MSDEQPIAYVHSTDGEGCVAEIMAEDVRRWLSESCVDLAKAALRAENDRTQDSFDALRKEMKTFHMFVGRFSEETWRTHSELVAWVRRLLMHEVACLTSMPRTDE